MNWRNLCLASLWRCRYCRRAAVRVDDVGVLPAAAVLPAPAACAPRAPCAH